MKHLLVLAILVSLSTVALGQEERSSSSTAEVGGVNTPQEDKNVALVMRLYEEAWNNDNYAVADEIFAPDYIRHDASDPVQGSGEAILQSKRTREVKSLLPDLKLESEVIMADGDMVAVRWTSRGNPADIPGVMRFLVGKTGPIVATGVNTYRFREGRVAEIWNNRDDLTIQREMGVFRWYALGGFLIGVLITLLGGWALRRRRSVHGYAGD